MFATYSFSHAGVTYNIEFYYRELYQRLRARVLVGDRELHGLFNRFYGVDPTGRYMLSVHERDKGKPEVSFNFGFLPLQESLLDTDAIYEAVEGFAGKTLPGVPIPWIRVYPPPGMLKKTCGVLMERFHLLVNEKGQIGPFTLENLLIAYCQEEIKAKEHEDFERIGRSIVNALGESMGLNYTVIADVNEVGRYGPKLLDSINAAEIKPPSLYRDSDSQTDYWNCYACGRYGMGPAILTRYRFGFKNGLLHSGERSVLGEDASGAYTGYSNLKNIRGQQEFIINDDGADVGFVKTRNLRSDKAVGTSPLLSSAALRLMFVGAGVLLLILAFLVHTCARPSSKVSIGATGAETPVCGTEKEETTNEKG